MGTEVLRPQDLLVERFHVPPASFHRRRNFPANGAISNLNINRKPNHTSNSYRKTSPKPEKKKPAAAENVATKKAVHGESRRKHDGGANGGSVMGQITLLRRGESMDSLTPPKTKAGSYESKSSPKTKPVDDLAILGIGRIGPESPEMLPKQIRRSPPPPPPNMYAGSVCDTSPSPQSLPLPSFFSKKLQIDCSNDPATRDLRRMLRLD
ncbi:hypothetical protein ACP275_07G022800 [Erythranthe tilingii]